jgi:3-oxoacyl-(acyl-carrier-protein) synthase
MKTQVLSSCQINKKQIIINNKVVLEALPQQNTQDDLLVYVYKHFGINYPKFYKMDVLSKLAFLATELIISETPEVYMVEGQSVGIVLSNKTSSIVSDLSHQKSIQDVDHFFPSPAVFVYTLPNIMIGEICIRHQFTGENSLFVSANSTQAPVLDYANYLMDEGLSKVCVCGWVDVTNKDLEAIIYIVKSK